MQHRNTNKYFAKLEKYANKIAVKHNVKIHMERYLFYLERILYNVHGFDGEYSNIRHIAHLLVQVHSGKKLIILL